jgi:hypothetical protein
VTVAGSLTALYGGPAPEQARIFVSLLVVEGRLGQSRPVLAEQRQALMLHGGQPLRIPLRLSVGDGPGPVAVSVFDSVEYKSSTTGEVTVTHGSMALRPVGHS